MTDEQRVLEIRRKRDRGETLTMEEKQFFEANRHLTGEANKPGTGTSPSGTGASIPQGTNIGAGFSQNQGRDTDITKGSALASDRTSSISSASAAANPKDTKTVETGPDKIASPSQNESDKAEDKVISVESKAEDGSIRITDSVDQEAADRQAKIIEGLPVAENLTQSYHGVPGQVNLTQHGTLAGDKSVRVKRTLEDINAEYEKVAGPNPTPNREGNEITKATNLLATQPQSLIAIDRDTSKLADELEAMRKKGSLDSNDKKRLEEMEKELRQTARV